MNSLRFKIITPFLLGLLILTVFLSYYTYSSSMTAVRESVLLISRAQTTNIYNSMSLLFGSMSTSVEKLTTDPHVTNLFLPKEAGSASFNADAENWFEILIQGNEYYRGILVVDKKGVCVASNSQMQVGVSYLDKPYVKTALSGEFVFSEPSIGRVTKNLSATVSAPVYIDGEVVGAVVMVNDFASIINYNRPEQDGIQSMFISLLDRGGDFCYSPR